MSASLLAAALSAITDHSVVTYDDFLSSNPRERLYYAKLDQEALHKSHLVGGAVPTLPSISNKRHGVNSTAQLESEDEEEPNGPSITVISIGGKKTKLPFLLQTTIADIKAQLEKKIGIPANDQALIFDGRRLDDQLTLSHYNVLQDDTFEMYVIQRGGGGPLHFYLQNEQLAPQYNFDFTNVDDKGLEFRRGHFNYKRPCGWNRIAIKVLDKYENNEWLGAGAGVNGHRQHSVKNEWPVSYHGTAERNCSSIAEDGYLMCKSRRFKFGHGIYSTPDIEVASGYAKTFTYRKNKYQAVFQNRVNPRTLVRISSKDTKDGEYWISPHQEDLRPYGICIKKIGEADDDSDSD